METIKIEVSVKLNLSEDVKNFVASLVSNSSKPASAPAVKQVQTSAPVAKPAQAPAAPAKPTSAPTAPAETTEKPADANDVTIEDVRKALSLKVANHRAEIKEKLNEFGAPSVTKLDPTKYKEMYDYLNSLD